ncbi:VCBS repeat-containing protein [candidate division KSB1 bacterium]|nr:VCBS repeat-containing protein [candidate division KSB1 bacterium]
MSKFIFSLLALASMALSVSIRHQQPIFIPAPDSPFAVGNRPWGIAVGDVNKDGKLDIVTANKDDNDATVLLGNGRSGFKNAPGSPFAAGAKPEFVAMGDLNGDGNLDLAFTQHDGSYDVTILFGDGNGKFQPAPHSPLTPLKSTAPHTHGLILNDVNGDGHLDIVTANAGFNAGQADNSVSVLLGNGKGGFKAATGSPFSLGKLPAGIVSGDVNKDGTPDLVATNEGSKDLSVFFGDGSGGFKATAGSPFELRAYGNYAAIGDINQDDNVDLVITHDDSNLLTILLGNGKGDFKAAPASPFDLGHRAWNVIIADMNNDTKTDLVLRGPDSRVVVLLGDGNGVFKPAPGSPFAVGVGPLHVAAADVNADGKLDILTANNGSNNVTVLLGRKQ